jgi:REP element-mobilizing transposase RayT
VANGFHAAMDEADYVAHACSILPEHVHLVLGPHQRDVRRMISHLKGRATQQLNLEDLHPLAAHRQTNGETPSTWARNGWVVFIFSEQHMRDAIRYVEENPVKEGKPRQKWSFVRPYRPTTAATPARSKLRR